MAERSWEKYLGFKKKSRKYSSKQCLKHHPTNCLKVGHQGKLSGKKCKQRMPKLLHSLTFCCFDQTATKSNLVEGRGWVCLTDELWCLIKESWGRYSKQELKPETRSFLGDFCSLLSPFPIQLGTLRPRGGTVHDGLSLPYQSFMRKMPHWQDTGQHNMMETISQPRFSLLRWL